jgi:hypothetical protein
MVALPSGVCQSDTEKQTRSLRGSFVDYFTSKNAAGVLEIKSNSSTWLVYMFPPCPFVEDHLNENAPDLKRNISGRCFIYNVENWRQHMTRPFTKILSRKIIVISND